MTNANRTFDFGQIIKMIKPDLPDLTRVPEGLKNFSSNNLVHRQVFISQNINSIVLIEKKSKYN
jgi:hypothetical protein